MMQFPQLPRKILRVEDKPGFEKEIWQPQWDCFCCQDTGIVRSQLVRLVIPDYDWDLDALPICQNPACQKHKTLGESVLSMVDYRLSAGICEQLDKFSRDDWKSTVQIKHEILQQLADSKSLRSRPRTQEEEQIAKDRVRMALEA